MPADDVTEPDTLAEIDLPVPGYRSAGKSEFCAEPANAFVSNCFKGSLADPRVMEQSGSAI